MEQIKVSWLKRWSSFDPHIIETGPNAHRNGLCRQRESRNNTHQNSSQEIITLCTQHVVDKGNKLISSPQEYSMKETMNFWIFFFFFFLNQTLPCSN